MAKMTDVAKLAGVSIKTVSRVINNEPHVRESLRQKVRAAAIELGYVPSATARSLRSNRSYTIQLVSHAIDSSYVYGIQAGVIMTCQERGYRLAISVIDPGQGSVIKQFQQEFDVEKTKGNVDAVILVPPFADYIQVTEILTDFGVRVARIGANDFHDDVINVMINERLAARELTEYLIGLGHKKIAFIRGKENQNATHERFIGYRQALADGGVELCSDLVCNGDFTFASGVSAGETLLTMNDGPTAIFAANDDMAAGVVVAGHRLGKSAPDDYSIVGFDDADFSERIWPGLTTVRQPMYELGAVAAERLIDSFGQLEEGRVFRHVVDHEVVYRASAGPLSP